VPKKATSARRRPHDAKTLRQNSQNYQNSVPSVNSVKKTKAFYRQPAPKPKTIGQDLQDLQDKFHPEHPVHPVKKPSSEVLPHAHLISTMPFELREDGSIAPFVVHASACSAQSETDGGDTLKRGHQTPPSTLNSQPSTMPPRLAFSDPVRGIWLYHGNSLELLDAIAAKYPAGRFDAIFADPPYFLPAGP
jgi:hypothetical protein